MNLSFLRVRQRGFTSKERLLAELQALVIKGFFPMVNDITVIL